MMGMMELSPIAHYDSDKAIILKCYADTLIYYKASGKQHNLVAMRFG